MELECLTYSQFISTGLGALIGITIYLSFILRDK